VRLSDLRILHVGEGVIQRMHPKRGHNHEARMETWRGTDERKRKGDRETKHKIKGERGGLPPPVGAYDSFREGVAPGGFSEGLVESIIRVFRGKTGVQANIVHLIDGSQCQSRLNQTNRRIINWRIQKHTVRPAKGDRVSDSSETQSIISPLCNNRADGIVFK